ncbi:MAG TPA: DUF6152 family protein [Gammaproteobacteria bacterium]
MIRTIDRTRTATLPAGALWPLALIVVAAVPTSALAHHSFAKFDSERTIEIEGEIVDVRWQNPHVSFVLRGQGADGQIQNWKLETASPGILRRMGVDAGVVAAGDRVKVVGNPAVGGSPEMSPTNMLLADGRELQLMPSVPLRFSDRGIGDQNAWQITQGDSSRPELGLFRVWSSTFASAVTLFPDNDERSGFTALDYPLTDAARRVVESFDRVEGSRKLANDCTPKGMPWIMEQPYDVAFERNGNDILLRLEEFDVVRRVHMDWSGDRPAEPSSPHGFSTGAWEGEALVVTTTNLSSPNFKWDVPQSEQAEIVERFTPSADGARLDYEIVVMDPATFTEPVRLEKYWISIPGQALDAYNCGARLSP